MKNSDTLKKQFILNCEKGFIIENALKEKGKKFFEFLKKENFLFAEACGVELGELSDKYIDNSKKVMSLFVEIGFNKINCNMN